MIESLSDEELVTYSRQIVLADIGYDGQLALRNAKVCLAGAGGLGSPTALKLTGMGVGFLRLVDRDIVSRSDLHRQHLYDTPAVGIPKVEAAARRLRRLNPDVVIDPVADSLRSANAESLLAGMDLVIDGLDRPEPRYVLNRSAHRLGIPYIFGAAIESFGNTTTIIPGRSFCLECFMPGLKDDELPKCGVVGVHPAVLGIVSALQVSEAVRCLTGKEPMLLNKLMYIDLRHFGFETLNLRPRPECPVCGSGKADAPSPVDEPAVEESCSRDGQRNFFVSPPLLLDIDLKRLRRQLKRRKRPVGPMSDLGLSFQHAEGVSVCLLKKGGLIVQAAPQVANIDRAAIWSLYRSILIEELKLPPESLPAI
jgi:adenylyltransferase/sulfurtransferase